MAEEAFDRVYSLAIGRNTPLIEKNIPQLLVRAEPGVPQLLAKNDYSDFNTIPNGAIVLTELNISASISSTKEGGENKQNTTIEITNLTKTNQEFIKAGDTVILKAGYRSINGTQPPMIFSGQVVSVATTKKRQNTTTKLVCTASTIARQNIRISKSPVRNETNEDIIKYFAAVAAENGIPTGYLFVPDIITYESGLPVSGSLFPKMEEFCKRFNLNCYVSLGRLYIEPRAVTAPASPRLIINPENIKESIRPEDDASGKSQSDPSNIPGIKFNTFLNPNITTATTVFISFGQYRGDYIVTSVNHKLTYEGKSWDTIVSCRKREG